MSSLAHRLAAALLVAATCAACAPTYTAFEIDRELSKTLGAAQFHLGLREYAEAGQLALAIERIDPEYLGLADVKSKLGSDVQNLFASTPIGSNRARRYPIERSLGERIARYLPDRLRDLLDVVTIEAHSGLGGFADLHATRAVSASAGARVVGGIGLYSRRAAPGFQLQADAGASLSGIGWSRFVGFTTGPSGVFSGRSADAGSTGPLARLYQDYRDYWAIGGSATLGIVGGSAELHPVQVFDFLVGFAGLDPGNDDSARTRPLRLLSSELELLQELALIDSSPELIEEYRRNRESLRAR